MSTRSRESLVPASARKIQCEQPLQYLLIAGPWIPSVGREHRRIEFLVRQREPRGPLVVEVRQRAFGKLRRAVSVTRDKSRIPDGSYASGIRVMHVACPWTGGRSRELKDLFSGPLRRVEPARA